MTRTHRQKQISLHRQMAKDSTKTECPTPNKARFETQDRAFIYAIKASRDSLPTKVYKCKCAGWHITTKRK